MTKLDMTPGAQIPRTDVGPQTAVTQLLSSAAYRDTELKALTDLEGVKAKEGKFALFRPSVGEAFSRAVIDRTLRPKRLPLVPSFGTDTRMVVEHCLAAEELRHARDRKLTLVTLLSGVLFLPGALLWLVAFQGRAYFKKHKPGPRGLLRHPAAARRRRAGAAARPSAAGARAVGAVLPGDDAGARRGLVLRQADLPAQHRGPPGPLGWSGRGQRARRDGAEGRTA